MRIGLIFIAYQNSDYLNSVLAPWKIIKHGLFDDNGLIVEPPNKNIDLKICAISALFKEYADLGHVYDNEQTEQILKLHEESGSIDKYIIINDKPILDYQSRVAAWDYLKQFDVDYVWQLDADEFYDRSQILKAINYIQRNPEVDFFRINFKNYIGDIKDRTYVDDFKPVRIINNKNRGGINNFYFDNDIEFNDKTRTPHCAGLTIPKIIIFPEHHTWVGPKEKLIKKIEYQHRAIGTCSYKWSNELNKLTFDENYYIKYGISKPEVFKD
jgi:hypothetical protein